MTQIIDAIIVRIKRKKRGWVFTPKDFLDLGNRATVDKTLSRLAARGLIRRLDRGIYDYPRKNKLLGVLSPNTDSIARALSADNKILPSGAMLTNLLGLSTQVPAKPSYLTNTHSRMRKIGRQIISLKHAKVPLIDTLSQNANIVLQTLSYLGKHNIDDKAIGICAHILTDKDLVALNHTIKRLPGWMADTIHKIERNKHG